MNILILGGSGILSTDFTNYCVKKNDRVYILNRGRNKHFINKSCELILSDLRNESIDLIRKKINFTHFDVVIDFLSYDVNHLKKTLSIIEGLFTQYIFISSATVYSPSSNESAITEETNIGNTEWDYANNKSICEKYLIKKDINYTIIRPYVTYGVSRIPFPIIPDKYQFSLIKRIIENKPVILFNDGSAICTLTNTKDFAVILYKLLLNTKAYKECFHITGNSVQSWKDVYFKYCELLSKKPNYISLNASQVNCFLPEFKEIIYGDKGRNMVFDNSKVLNVIGGYEFKYDLNLGLRESVEFYMENSYMQGIDYKWDGMCDFVANKVKSAKLKPIISNNQRNTNKMWYYIMTNNILRNIYYKMKKVKKVLRSK